jgi:hypothetical protein
MIQMEARPLSGHATTRSLFSLHFCKTVFIRLPAALIFCALSTISAANNNTNEPLHIVRNGWYNPHYSLQLPLKDTINNGYSCQTLAHLYNSGYKDRILDEDYVQKSLKQADSSVIENLINAAIEKEKEYIAKNCIIFYHGQMREFLLMQDLLVGLFRLIHKKTINNFVYLRTPDKDFDQFHTVQQFLAAHGYSNVWDVQDPDRKVLLSVNAWLFGNSRELGWSSLYYFLASYNFYKFDFTELFTNVFRFFNISDYYEKYKDSLTHLNELLSTQEKQKTGLLLQICIPKTLVDTITYRSQDAGIPYYHQHDPFAMSPIDEITLFKDSNKVPSNLDEAQYRILLDKQLMLNPDSGIKIFRYCNYKTSPMKQYEKGIQDLFTQLANDLKHDGKVH